MLTSLMQVRYRLLRDFVAPCGKLCVASHPNPLRVILRAAPRSSNSALTTVLSRATLGPVTEAPGVPSLGVRDMFDAVGSATFLSR